MNDLGDAGRNVMRNLRVVRTTRGLSVRTLSTRLAEIGRPIVPSSISQIETGNRRVDVGDLAALALVLDVEPWSLAEALPCDVCNGYPASGFTCNHCGRSS